MISKKMLRMLDFTNVSKDTNNGWDHEVWMDKHASHWVHYGLKENDEQFQYEDLASNGEILTDKEFVWKYIELRENSACAAERIRG